MLTLTELTPKIRIGIYMGVIILVILVLGLFIVRSQPITPKPLPPSLITTSVNHPVQVEEVFTFLGELPELPSRVDVYTGTSVTDIRSVTQNLALQLELQPSIDNSYWYRPNSNEVLSYSATANQLNYTRETTQSDSVAELEQSFQIALSYLSKIQLTVTLIPNRQTAGFYNLHEDDPHLETSVQGSANTIVFEVAPEINGIPIFYDSYSEPIAQIWVKNNSEVIKFTLNDFVVPYTLYTQVRPINKNTLNRRLQEGQGQIVDINPQDLVIGWDNLNFIDLSTARLEYRFSPDTKFIYPYYRLSGTAILNQTIPTEVEVIVPAY